MKNRARSMMRFFPAAIITGCLLSACSTSPMQARLEKNFVYNCTLELIGKGVTASEANRICVSSHEGELQEKDSDLKAKAPPVPAPTSTPAPAETVAKPAVNTPSVEERAPASEFPSVEP